MNELKSVPLPHVPSPSRLFSSSIRADSSSFVVDKIEPKRVSMLSPQSVTGMTFVVAHNHDVDVLGSNLIKKVIGKSL